MVTQTSLLAFTEHLGSGGAGRQHRIILDALCWGDNYSNMEICSLTGLPINVVTARVFELRANDFLVEAGKRRCSLTKREVLVWQRR